MAWRPCSRMEVAGVTTVDDWMAAVVVVAVLGFGVLMAWTNRK